MNSAPRSTAKVVRGLLFALLFELLIAATVCTTWLGWHHLMAR
jgi:hypothetical protein